MKKHTRYALLVGPHAADEGPLVLLTAQSVYMTLRSVTLSDSLLHTSERSGSPPVAWVKPCGRGTPIGFADDAMDTGAEEVGGKTDMQEFSVQYTRSHIQYINRGRVDRTRFCSPQKE